MKAAHHIRGFFAGSGMGAFSDPNVVDRLLSMTGRFSAEQKRVTETVTVVYLGTATYDLPDSEQKQTSLLHERGCRVVPLAVANPEATAITAAQAEQLRTADIVLVSGGNTLYAIRRWEESGVAKVLKEMVAAAVSGERVEALPVFAGGSAGAICWFTSGHSDSADPSTYVRPMMLSAFGKEKEAAAAAEDASSSGDTTSWFYIRVHGLNLMPGFLCPHFDQVQSNGVLREEDFSKMMKRHPTERGIALDHWSVLILDGKGHYEVFAVPGKTRSCPDVGAVDSSAALQTTPGVFTLDVQNSVLTRSRVAPTGAVEDILREPRGPLVSDPFERYFAMQNPTPSSGALVRR